ncbi:MAG TPA: hypothetical protein VLM84_05770, partial [Chromatiaceae bacterium]|nr:hypothetical protein [Chromatiaceae bacterium]
MRPLPWILAAFVAGMASVRVALWLAPDLLLRVLPAGQAPAASPADQGGTSFAGAVRRAAPGVVCVFSSVILSQRQPLGARDPKLQHRYG